MTKRTFKVGEFGTIYPQFKNKPKEAILFLKKKKSGECIKALYREEIGYVDIVWGENDENNLGYGLKHIIEKHGNQIRKFGYEVEDFIPFAFQFGKIQPQKEKYKIRIANDSYMVVLLTEWKDKNKTLLLTSFTLKKKKSKK
jgi:mRNA-degrading endonuclease RelE of RelBE toxin-antitoxin system